jgi:two-component system phosphate regulon sensor histidine kinase PhoR
MFRRFITFHVLLLVVLLLLLLVGVVVLVPDADIRLRLFGLLGFVTLLGVIAAVVLEGMIAYRITHSLSELLQATRRIEQGHPWDPVQPRKDDELAVLEQSFSRTARVLGKRIGQLEEDRQHLSVILNNMVEGVMALDGEQRILFVNSRATDLLQLDRDACAGRRIWEVVRHRPLLDMVRNVLDNPAGTTLREEMGWYGENQRSLSIHAVRLDGFKWVEKPSRHPGAILVLHDQSELRWLEKVRQEFVANVSHELKTPLAVINVCVETLLDGALEDVEHRSGFLEQISRQSQRLHALILDLLSLARIESGAEDYEIEDVNLAQAVSTCIERHRARAEARGQQLQVAPSLPDLERGGAPAPEMDGKPAELTAWTDEDALDQILDNLLDNAVKYTPERGQIRIWWWREEDRVLIEVSDTGIGIPQADLPRIFERFYRVDKARSRVLGGTGLGLSIVKHLVQAVFGTIKVASRPGEGTTFTLSLPHKDRGPWTVDREPCTNPEK